MINIFICLLFCMLDGNPYQSIPAKWFEWNTLYPEEYITTKLDADQLECYKMYLKRESLTSDQKIVNCFYCDSYQVWSTNPATHFFYCANSECGKAFCTLCKYPVKNNRKKRKTEQEQIDYEAEKHPNWSKFKNMRLEWELGLEKSSMRFCPNPSCKTKGAKDTEWTHMKWPTCGTSYCYFWGKAEADWDKADPNGKLASHNIDWDTNPNRCPLVLIDIQQIDPKWSYEDDDGCLDLLHKILIYTFVTDFREKYTPKVFDEFWSTFNIQDESQLNIKQILNTDLTMISRFNI